MSSKPRRKFEAEYKINAVRMVEVDARSMAEIARELGIHENTLYKWKRDYGRRGDKAFPGNGKRAEPVNDAERAQAEIDELKRRLARTEMERDILKKAMSIFTRQ